MTSIHVPPYPDVPELPEDPRERFQVLWKYRTEVQEILERFKVLDEQLAAELTAAMPPLPPDGRKGGKKGRRVGKDRVSKRSPIEVLGEERYNEIRGPYEQICAEVVKYRRAEIDRVEELLNQTADSIPLTPDPTVPWIKRDVDTVWSSTYSTQGFGAQSYARSDAEMRAHHYVQSGLPAEVRMRMERDDHPGDTFWARSDLTRYEVWVQASEEDAEIARYKSGLSLKEWMQWCWDHNTNPRVVRPFLPHGLEEQLGVVMVRYGAQGTSS